MTYRVTHRTSYRYEDEVSASYGQLHLLLRDLPGQECHESLVVIDPPADDYRERYDFFGNRAAYFSILSPHRTLSVTTTSEVNVAGRQDGLPGLAATSWEQVRDEMTALGDAGSVDAFQFTLDSPLVTGSEALADYSRPSFLPGRPVIDALADLAVRVHADFSYEPGATKVSTTVEEVLNGRKGVCQDFAHLVIGCLRSLGLAARYVSGYLETSPPPGQPRLTGTDVSHAWASLFVPGGGWIDADPTNHQLVDDRYITTAWGRDYRDVPPLKGVIYTEGTKHDLEVVVDVLRVS